MFIIIIIMISILVPSIFRMKPGSSSKFLSTLASPLKISAFKPQLIHGISWQKAFGGSCSVPRYVLRYGSSNYSASFQMLFNLLLTHNPNI